MSFGGFHNDFWWMAWQSAIGVCHALVFFKPVPVTKGDFCTTINDYRAVGPPTPTKFNQASLEEPLYIFPI